MSIKSVLLHFSKEEHERLSDLKDSLNLTWEEFIKHLSKLLETKK